MSQFVETPCRGGFTASGALGQYLRVKDNGSSKLALAGASDIGLGTLEFATFADGDAATVRLHSAQGTRKMVASEAIDAYATVYAAAGGKIASTGTIVVGYALAAASGNNSVIEVMYIANTDIANTITGTNAATFEVDADASTPKLAIKGQSGGSGDYTTTLQPESTLSGDNAITVPEADGDVLAAIALAQSLTNKTLGAGTKLTVGTATATGSNQGDAAALGTAVVQVVSAGDDTKGVILPTAAAGDLRIVLNSGSAGLKIYPNTDDKINNGSADAAITILENTLAILVATAADNWGAIFTANS